MNYPAFLKMTCGTMTAALSLLMLEAAEAPADPAQLAPVSNLVRIDTTAPAPAPQALPFPAGGRSPSGQEWSVNTRYFMLDGKPVFPVMGEFHFSRYPEGEWEEEILKMKAGGITIVANYVFWIHHEEVRGEFEWAGRKDLRRFVELCGKHGMYLWLRVGPWAHGEARNGGLPDWVLDPGPVRANSPEYLAATETFYNQIGRQVKGLFWKDGGPIIGVQLENEYNRRGQGQGEAHMLELLRLARAAGLDAPFYTATGWDNAVVPPSAMLPVFSGYPDGFWFGNRGLRPPSGLYFFHNIKNDELVGDNLQPRDNNARAIEARYADRPYATAEMAGGMATSYLRRPVFTGDDVAALELVKLGSGATVYGFYMYHGGTNPDGKLTTLMEAKNTRMTNYNDMTVMNYDFQAPLGEFGQMHPSFRPTKVLNYFLDDFGALLAPMATYFPDARPSSRNDFATPRAAARVSGDSAFVFINNFQKDYALPARENFQVELVLPSGTVKIPSSPTTIPSGAYMIWPVNLDLGAGVKLVYATAQPVAKLDNPRTFVFAAWQGVPVEVQIATPTGAVATVSYGASVQDLPGNQRRFTNIAPGTNLGVQVSAVNVMVAQIIVLSREQALDLWKGGVAGQKRLWISPADSFTDGGKVVLRSRDPANLRAGFLPALALPGRTATENGVFREYNFAMPPVNIEAVATVTKPAGEVAAPPAAPRGRGPAANSSPPSDDVFNTTAASWKVTVPALASGGVKRAYLDINYQGDIARIYDGDKLVFDDFYKGSWEIGLWRFTPEQLARGVDLRIYPLRSDAPVYIPEAARPQFADGEAQMARLQGVRVVPEYEAIIEAPK